MRPCAQPEMREALQAQSKRLEEEILLGGMQKQDRASKALELRFESLVRIVFIHIYVFPYFLS